MYKELLQFNVRKANNPILKQAKGLTRHSSKKEIQMKNCSTPLFKREMKIKTKMEYHFIPTKMTALKTKNIYICLDVEES